MSTINVLPNTTVPPSKQTTSDAPEGANAFRGKEGDPYDTDIFGPA